jgi:DNA recombination protein RmuC
MNEILLVVLVLLDLGLLVAVGYVIVLARRRSDESPTAALAERLDKLGVSFGEATGKSSLDIQGRVGREFADLKTAIGGNLAEGRKESGAALAQAITQLEGRFESLQRSNEERLKALQADNSQKLDQMRATVDEKLQKTLESRLGESFKLVCERLDVVHKGLGEMQSLANGVGDLKKVLTNVKTRGTWGEVQLGALLGDVLAPEQYEAQVVTRPNSSERVDFAIKLPGRDKADGEVLWLPIDAKFPQEDYQRLLEAQDRADAEQADAAGKELEKRIRLFAKDICDKYINPPHTVDFALMFLPTEGLYAEVLRRPGLADLLQREHRVVVVGPTTLWALLNSLQMGFRTLAIEQRSSEVWKVLGAVKAEFGKFGDILDRVHKQIETASTTIESAATKSRTIERKLRTVEELPAAEVAELLGIDEESGDDELIV